MRMLLKLWWWIVGGCDHQWKTVDVMKVFKENNSPRPCAHIYVLECTRCGTITQKTLSY
jgi:hypothetical protein